MSNEGKKKILFLLHIPPPVHGSSVVGKIIQDSKLINSNFSCRYINLLASKSIQESGKVNFKKITGFVFTWFRLLKDLVLHKTDLCYFALTTTGTAFFKDVFLVLLLRVFRIKTIYHLHNKGIFSFQEKRIYNLCYRFVFKKSDVIILSEYLYYDVEAFVKKENVHICHNGVPDEYIRNNFQKIEKDNPVSILFLSNLIESKGVNVLLDACKIIKDRGTEFNCDFIGGEGDISISQFNEMVTQKDLNEHVRYLGKKYGEEKLTALSGADIFVFPTYYPNECFPLVLLEAMQFELPVVSTYEGGIRDMVDEGKTGYLAEKKDPNGLANLIIRLIDNRELRRMMGAAGREKYLNEFTIDKFELRMVEILNNTVNTK